MVLLGMICGEMMKFKKHTVKELEQKLEDLELQITPDSAPPDYIDVSIGVDQKEEKIKLKEDLVKELKIKKDKEMKPVGVKKVKK